jgi:hypothetical protein
VRKEFKAKNKMSFMRGEGFTLFVLRDSDKRQFFISLSQVFALDLPTLRAFDASAASST